MLHNLDRRNADSHHLAHQPDDVARIVLTVGIGLTLHLILIDHPLQCGSRSQPVFERCFGNLRERQRFIHSERPLIRAQFHLGHPLGKRNAFIDDFLERPRIERFILDMQSRQFFPGFGKGRKVVSERNPG